MSNGAPLKVYSVFGANLENTYLLAANEDDRWDEDGEEIIPDSRTILLRLRGDKAFYVSEVTAPIFDSWRSNNGTVYCVAAESTKLFIWKDDTWTTEDIVDSPINANSIFGISGDTSADDQLFITTDNCEYYARCDGKWIKSKAPKKVNSFIGIYGLKKDEIYIGGSALFMWDGSQVVQVEEPANDSVYAFHITPDDRIICGHNYLHISDEDGGWENVPTSFNDFMSMAKLNDKIFAATYDSGIVQVFPGTPIAVTEKLETDNITSVGDGLVAVGDSGIFVSPDGESWKKITISY
ncbi:MAG: hypothetical protein JXX14_13755 [Deltaproteobacteria bacterium]|nr:hypothetical protein [Deltaproteobacteria bacterium]